MKLAAFDIEIFKSIPEGETDWKALRPLGISCMAILTNDGKEITSHVPAFVPRPLNSFELTHTVADCLTWRRPNTSWMSNPITRESLLAWTK